MVVLTRRPSKIKIKIRTNLMMMKLTKKRKLKKKGKTTLICRLGKEEMGWVSTKKYLSSKEAIMNSGELWLKWAGTRTKMYGRRTSISNGQPRLGTSII